MKNRFTKNFIVILLGILFVFYPLKTAMGANRTSVTTDDSVQDITSTSATAMGTVEQVQGSALYEKGICYSLESDSTIDDNRVVCSLDTDDIGSFNVSLTGLQPNTTYYYRAYVTNNKGTVYGDEYTFTTLNQYTITYSAGEGGYIDGNSEQIVECGESTTQVTAVPDWDYCFVEWSDNHSNNPTRIDTNVTSSETYTAVFAYAMHTITYSAGEGGYIRGNSNQHVKTGESTTQVTAVPNWGYRFVEWSDNHSTNPTRIDTDVTSSETYTAVFTYDMHRIIYSAGEGGYITGNSNQLIKTGESTTTVTAVPNWGYRFVEWSDNHSTNPTRIDTNVTSSETYTAVFAYDMHRIIYSAGEGGYIQGNSNQLIKTGESTTTVTAVPNWGYHFVEWSDNHSTNPTRTDVGVTESATYYAVFSNKEQVFYTVCYSAGTGGSIVGENTQKILSGNSTATVTATPNEGYHFVEWADNHNTNPVRTDNNVTASATYYAVFARNKYTITFDTAGGTDIDPITQDCGTTITAPDDPTKAGYTFIGWDKDIPTVMPAKNIIITAKWMKNEGAITITNNVDSSLNSGQSFVFEIKRIYESTIQKSYVVIQGSDSITLTQLPPGTYTITQKISWSWRYAIFPRQSYTFTIDSNNLTHKASFTNTLMIYTWLSDVTYLINRFMNAY